MASAFGKKKDERTAHQRFCNYEIAKASRSRVYGGTRPLGKAPSGIKSNGYTNLELKNLLTKMI